MRRGQPSFHSGRISEALLERHAIAAGHTAVVFRRRHAAALTNLAPEELADYWLDIQDVARAVERVFAPCHINYQLLGNLVYTNVGTANNLPLAAAVALIPVAIMSVFLLAVRRTGALDNL